MTVTADESTYTDQADTMEGIDRGRSIRNTIRLGVFSLALVLAGVMTVLFLPELLATLVTGWTSEGAAELGVHRLHVMGIAAVAATFLIGLFAQAYRPRNRVAVMWGAFATIAIATAGTVYYGVGRPEEVIPFLVITGLALVAHPAGRGLFTRAESVSLPMLGLLAVAAIPILAFVATQMSLTTNPLDAHAVDGHYVMMIALVMAPLAYGLVAALGLVGWRLAAWIAALPIAYYGMLSMAFTTQAGSSGIMWGALAILWAIAFVAVAEYTRTGRSGRFRRTVGGSN